MIEFRSTLRVVALSAALIFAVSVPLANAQETPAADAWPEWLREAMEKESGLFLRTRKITVGDKLFKSRLVGKQMSDPQAIDGGWYVATNIGTASPLECWIFTESVDPATMAANIADVSMQATAEANGALGERNVYYVDAGAYNAAPYLALEWMYTVGEAPDSRVGLAKVRVAMQNDVTLACAHNFLGYRQTFARAFEQFVRFAEVRGDKPSHYYQEVMLQTIGDQPVGVSRSTFTHDGDGDTEIKIVESSLIPVDASNLHVSDTWRSGFSHPDGTLINQNVAKSENGEVTMALALDPRDSGTWQVSGTFHGKEIDEKLDGAIQPQSELGQMLAVQELLADEQGNELTMDIWLPDADPTRFLQAGIELQDGRREDRFASLTLGPMSIAAQFDSSGSLLNGTMQAGAAEMRIERIWASGTLP